MTPDIGRLRHRLALEMAEDRPDGAGGFRRDWRDAGALWARIEAVSAGDDRAERHGQKVSHRITMRWRDDLTTDHRFRDGTRIYTIRSAHDTTGEKRFLVVLTEELRP